ncbi:MFS transporter [Streptomyces meridianus]|uniref:MFS transporter n=1 Tax=Streptomyces meridianus TaxID=2938945 RepID=A0ABT0X7L3_9ACTN|nr:MFS transporter [Streptomyces meridianus]MCM2578515.1 MFS transporter [Streptomyces meridianus]
MIRHDPPARTMLAAISVSSIGFGIHTLAMGQLLYDRTGRPEAFALVLTLQGLAAFCVLPVCGPLVDAANSKRVYVACGLGRAVTVALIIGITFVPGRSAVPYIVGVAVLLAVFDNIERSALFKFTAHHVDGGHVTKFNSLVGVAFQAGALSGMALLGLILTWGTPRQALLVDVVTSLCCALAVSRIRLVRPEETPVMSARMLRSAVAGTVGTWRLMLTRYRQDRVVLVLIVMCAADFVFAQGLSTLVVPLADEFRDGQGWYIAALEGTFAVGMISASFFTSRLVVQRLLPVWLLIQGGSAVLLAVGESATSHFAGFFLAGFANLNSLTWLLTSLQQRAQEGDKAKMASLRLLAIGLGTAVLMPLVGWAAGSSLGTGFTGLALIMAVFGLCGIWVARVYVPRSGPDPAVAVPGPAGEPAPTT